MSKFKVNQLVVLKETVGSCYCASVKKGTIVQIQSINEFGNMLSVKFYSNDNRIQSRLNEQDIRALNPSEKPTAKKKFETATSNNYATVD